MNKKTSTIIARLTFSALFIIFISALPARAQEIQWELANPFRFITDQKLWDELRATYDNLGEDKSALALERKLQVNHQSLVKETLDKQASLLIGCKQRHKNDSAGFKACAGKLQTDYMGWFSQLARDNYAATCWNGKKKKFRNDGVCRNYFFPASHKIKLWISDANVPAADLKWTKNNEEITIHPCGENFHIPGGAGGCYDATRKYLIISVQYNDDYENAPGTEISATTSDGTVFATGQPVKVKDKLIVGLGDSYASGEGNPDIPVTFKAGRRDKDSIFFRETIIAPRRDKPAAVWMDNKCHRSMYSYQFKTALQVALDNPREAVTYASYACSGGTTINLLSQRQQGRDAQLKRLEIDLCSEPRHNFKRDKTVCPKKEKRPIDYLLISTGGNDIGFADFVADVVISEVFKKQTRFLKWANRFKPLTTPPTPQTENSIKRILTANYGQLQQALMSNFIIRGDTPENIKKRILLTSYPDIFNDENGTRCEGNRHEFKRPFGNDSNRAQRIINAQDWVFKPLVEFQKQALDKYGWSPIDTHSDAYREHGFCAQKRENENTENKLLPAENFLMPYLEGESWDSFNPRDYKTYETRQRWIRLPVDSKLSIDQYTFKSLELFLEDDRSTIMHPTAEGHAATAQANFEKIK